MTPPRLRGVLLDVDGTLIDSNDAHAAAWADAFRGAGYDIGEDRIRPLIGMGGDKLLPQLTGLDHESDAARRLVDRRKEIFRSRYLPTLRAFPGAHELLARFRQDDLKLVIATSAGHQELNELLEQTGLQELIDRKTSSSDVDRSKPDPDIIHAALQRGHLRPDEAVMLGDTPYDIEAAARAGVSCVALRCGGWPDRALAKAMAIYDDAGALLATYALSPFASGSVSRSRE